MKKSIIYIMSLWIVFGLGWFWLCEWQKYGWKELQSSNPYLQGSLNNCKNGETDLWNCISVNENDDTIIVKLLKNFWLDSDTWKDHKFIDYARAIMNMALWLVSFIALAMTIYTFYLMFFTENEAGIKKAKWNLTGIFIALAIIWLAWLIVSFIFRWYESNWLEKIW
jgi:hypothetical protein